MTNTKIIHGSLDEIVEAVMEEMFEPATEGFSKTFQSHQKQNIRKAIERFVVCEECGTKAIQSGILTGVCPQCTMKGGDDEG